MSRDTSFYYSFLVLPPRKRNAILAVWDFCRAVDDAVDEVVPENEWNGGLTPAAQARAVESIATWRDELDRIYGGIPLTSQGKSLQQWVEKGVAPEKIIGTGPAPLAPAETLSRPICPYPQSSHYRGSGNTSDAANFVCAGALVRQSVDRAAGRPGS